MDNANKHVAATFAAAHCATLRNANPDQYFAWYNHFLNEIESQQSRKFRRTTIYIWLAIIAVSFIVAISWVIHRLL